MIDGGCGDRATQAVLPRTNVFPLYCIHTFIVSRTQHLAMIVIAAAGSSKTNLHVFKWPSVENALAHVTEVGR